MRHWIGKNLHKHIRNGFDKEEKDSLIATINEFISNYQNDISMQLSLIVPISLPPMEEPGFSKELVTHCEMELAKICGGFTTLISEGGWYDKNQFVKDYHRSIYSEFKLSSWEEVCETLRNLVIRIQETAKQRCVWLSIDGVSGEVNLLREKEVESFPQQSEFGGIDPDFNQERNETLPSMFNPISISELNFNFTSNVTSGILGGVGNHVDNSKHYITNNHIYTIPDTSAPPLVEKSSMVDKFESISVKRTDRDNERYIAEIKEVLIDYPKAKQPDINQNYPKSSIRKFLLQNPSNEKSLVLDYDDVYNDWNEINQFIRTKSWQSIITTLTTLCVILSIGNLLGFCSISVLTELEFFFIGAGFMIAIDAVHTEDASFIGYNLSSTIASYVLIGPIFFAIFIMPILGLIGTAMDHIFEIQILWQMSFNFNSFIENYISFFKTNAWAYSVVIHILLDINWRMNLGFENKIITKEVFDTETGLFLGILRLIKILFAGYLANILVVMLFKFGIISYLIFFALLGTLGLYNFMYLIKRFISNFVQTNMIISLNRDVNSQVDLFKNGSVNELSKSDFHTIPIFQLHGRYHLNVEESFQVIEDFALLSWRKLVCDLIRNHKFNVIRLPGRLMMYSILVRFTMLRLSLLMMVLIMAIPLIILYLLLSLMKLLGGALQDLTFIFNISENIFNLNHDRIKNEIIPRIHEMEPSDARNEVITSYVDYDSIVHLFYLTDFLCYANGTKHISQKLKASNSIKGSKATRMTQRKRR